MAREIREIEKELKMAGFTIIKYGTKHVIWSNGEVNIPMSRGSKINPFTVKAMRVRLRRLGIKEAV
jgi:hypothetical protein